MLFYFFRIVITNKPEGETDYYHANWIKLKTVDRNTIAAQAPLEDTVADFWRMGNSVDAVLR